jgi:hypothetical protein
MSLPSPDSDRLDDYRFQFGHDAGNLARVMDLLTDAAGVVGQHTVYCRVEKGPRAGRPPLDVAEVLKLIGEAKGLVQESLARLKGERPE